MRFSELLPMAADLLADAGQRLTDELTPTVRLGVTGLSRSGKTVLITALVRALTTAASLPAFAAQTGGRFERAWLEPQPDDHLPRFDYEAHLAALGRDPPAWPEGTRALSQLRLTIAYGPQNSWLGSFHPGRLHVDIVDYPGEWLIDLGLLGQDYAAWSANALDLATAPVRAEAAAPFRAFLAALQSGSRPPASGPEPESTAMAGAAAFTAYLQKARAREGGGGVLGPGRFLMAGELAGSPLLAFFPLPPGATISGPLRTMLERRFESYKTHVVRPFFRDHFARLDRQIVLVDVLGALNGGPAAVVELERGLDAVMAVLRPRAGSWLDLLTGRRLDKVLFCATKADHLHRESHDRLEAILRLLCTRAVARTSRAGASVEVLALASLRSTYETISATGEGDLPCIAGVPLPGERLGSRCFDGVESVALFPGDLPANPEAALREAARTPGDVRFLRFRPPHIAADDGDAIAAPAPNIGLDRAIAILLGDKLT